MDFSLLAKYAEARRDVLFVSVGHSGQFNPLLAIAKAFYRQYPAIPVTFATSLDLSSVVKGAGLRFLPVWESSKLPQDLALLFNKCGIRSVDVMKSYALWARSEEMFGFPRKMLANWMQDNRPSIAVVDVCTEAGMSAASDTNTRYIVNSPCPPYTSFPDCLPTVFPPVGSGTSLYKTSIWHRLYDLAAGARYGYGLVKEVVPIVKEQEARGIHQPGALADKSELFFNATSEKLSDPRVRFPENKLMWIGASLDDDFSNLTQPLHFDLAWKAAREADSKGFYSWIDDAATSEKPLVFIALGTLYQLDESRVAAMYEALSSLPIKVLWKLSRKEQDFVPQQARHNKDFHIESWIPSLPLVLAHPKVKLFINHGGGNSLHEGLFFGKSMVCLPAWMDCFDFAMRCQDAGAGIAITTAPRLDKQEFQTAIQRVLFDEDSDKFTIKACEVAADLQTLGGATKAAHEIKRILDQKQVVMPIAKVEQVSITKGNVLSVMTLPPC